VTTFAICRSWPWRLGVALLTCLVMRGGMAAESDLDSDRAAAAAGDPEALVRLAERYETGDGVPFDLDASEALLELAAERGSAPAQYRLGLLQAGGLDPDADLAEAYGWLQLAAQDDQSSSGLLAMALSEALADRLDGAAVESALQRVAAFQPTSGPAELPKIGGAPVADPTTLLAMLPPTGCGRPELRRNEDGLVLLAYAPTGSLVDAALTPELRSDLARRGAALDIAELSPAVCAVRDVIAGAAVRHADGVSVAGTAQDGPARLLDGDELVVEVAAASEPRYLTVDYVGQTGEVYHLYPGAGGDGYLPAGQAQRLGDGTAGTAWKVGAPFGDDMVLVTLASAPAAVSPASEPVDSYRTRLQRRLGTQDDSLRLFERVVTIEGP
jgi:hypothetical protein